MMNESGDTVIDLDRPSHEQDEMEFGGLASNDDMKLNIQGTIGSKEPGDDHDDDESGSEDEIELLSASKVSKPAAIWKFEYWQGFFDVDTNDVLHRLVASVDPRKNFIRAVRPNADLYGPVWICITLSFAVLISGNLSGYLYYYLHNKEKGDQTYPWHYNFHVVTEAAVVIFSYAWIVPIIVWAFLWWRNSRAGYSLLEILSIYGYSLAVFIPISFLWIIRSVAFRWIVIAVGIALSGGVLVRTFWPAFKADNKKTAAVAMLLIFAMHASIGIGFQLYFFEQVSENIESPSTNTENSVRITTSSPTSGPTSGPTSSPTNQLMTKTRDTG